MSWERRNKMSEGKLKERLWNIKEETNEQSMTSGRITIALCDLEAVLNEMVKDAPKPYVYTDYTHDFGDPQAEDYVAPKPEDYPRYWHIPDDKEWRGWFDNWLRSSVCVDPKKGK
jgi:hypothetical protein